MYEQGDGGAGAGSTITIYCSSVYIPNSVRVGGYGNETKSWGRMLRFE